MGMKKVLLLLFVFVSCCMMPLSAATVSDEDPADKTTVCANYDKKKPVVRRGNRTKVTHPSDDMYGVGHNNQANKVKDDDDDADNNTTGISTASVVVQDMDALDLTAIDEAFFKKMQSEFLTYVQKVNWETDMSLTPRDSGWFLRACKYVCQGFRSDDSMGINSKEEKRFLSKTANKITKKVGDAFRKYTCNQIMCLTIEELVRIAEVENSFILLAVDLDTFKEVISLEPKVASLYKNMFKFFKARATMVGGDYNQNTKELLRISRFGENGYFETWKELAQFAQHSKELDSKGQLNPQTEMAAQIKILEVAMLHLADKIKVKREVAKQLKKNPAVRAAAKQLKRNTKRPTRKQRASTYLDNNAMTVDEAARWVRKY